MWSGALMAVLARNPPGPGPFGSVRLAQPVPGAARGFSQNGWKDGKLCNVTQPPFNAVGDGTTNNTHALQSAIDECGDSSGGTVLLPAQSGNFLTGSLWLRSNLTFRIEEGATLLGSVVESDAPIVYTRRSCVMMQAHAGLLNGARCRSMKSVKTGGDDCADWGRLSNVVIEGDGTIDGDGEHWFGIKDADTRPMMLDLLWIDGLTLRDLHIRRPGFWTTHPCFCSNVRATGLDILTDGKNTDGFDPDSSWNVYIANNTFSTGDDCIAIKSGRDDSGLKVNISTQNVLAEGNLFRKGHGVSIGSETGGWVRDITVRDSHHMDGTRVAVRIKSCKPRGGGVENVLYENMVVVGSRSAQSGSVEQAVQITLNYGVDAHGKGGLENAGNVNDVPQFHNITIKDLTLKASKTYLQCDGLQSSVITGVEMINVSVTGSTKADCHYCEGVASNVSPKPCFSKPSPTPTPAAPTPPPTPAAPTPPPPPTPSPPPTPAMDCTCTKQLSSKTSPCTLGKTFGCYAQNQSMWVNGGCRGEFHCDGKSGVKCDVHGSRGEIHICKC